MCIIAYKPENVPFPEDWETHVREMFRVNSDGFGMMYPVEGGVRITKGFFDVETVLKVIESVDSSLPLALHFRIATSGNINPQCCHPFPITDDTHILKSTDIVTKFAVAHNGVLLEFVGDVKARSDTMNFSMYIAENNPSEDVVKKLAGSSKLLFMTKDKVNKMGYWQKHDGIEYSNSSYEPWTYTKSPTTTHYNGFLGYKTGSDLYKPEKQINGHFPWHIREERRCEWCTLYGSTFYTIPDPDSEWVENEYIFVCEDCCRMIDGWTREDASQDETKALVLRKEIDDDNCWARD